MAEKVEKDSKTLPHPTRRNWHWLTIQFMLRLIFTFWLRYRARGIEKVPEDGGALFLINHQSFLDPLLVGLPLQRPVSYLARDTLFPVPVIGWVLRNTYVMPINRDAASTASIREAVRRMAHGFLVGIFPEGTRTTNGSVGEFKPGFVALIRRAKVPVYPIGIAGAHEAYPRKKLLLRPRKVYVVFGDPFTDEEIAALSKKGQEENLVEEARKRIVACQEEAEAWRVGELSS
ncbi:MAG: 1-acyl-sn-glycerol-3-phosphate acyltransferase [Planctomycetaceae bacterium]|nr:1-acyl-sn-glycerol-3-phosphate acyltransferase [Planctomycetaceae bacterium]